MTFKAAEAGVYQDKQPPGQQDGIAEVATNPQPGQKLAFDISGDGMLQSQDQEAANGRQSSGASESGPGGGLGAPIEAPDPLDKYRGWIIGGFGIVLVAGAIYTVNRSKAQAPVAAGGGWGGGLLEGLKEELFQLEVEHKKGQISDEEYAKTKAALDQTLTRAIKRQGKA